MVHKLVFHMLFSIAITLSLPVMEILPMPQNSIESNTTECHLTLGQRISKSSSAQGLCN